MTITTTKTTEEGTVLVAAAKVEGSVTLSVNSTAAAEELVADEQVAEGWRRAIAEIAGTSATYVQLDPPPFVLERRLGFARGLTEEAVNVSSPPAAKIVVPYVITVPADSEDHAANLSSLLAASIASTSPSELTESIARHVSEATGGAEYPIVVVEEIAEPTFGVVLQQVTVTLTSLSIGLGGRSASSFAYSSRALHLSQAIFLAARIVSVLS
jgi:hypothetical protein